MTLVWINPSFLDYRIPVYRRLYELTDGQFTVVFSSKRTPDRVSERMRAEIGKNALGLSNERIVSLGKFGDFSNQGIQIPYQPGLLTTILEIKPRIIITEGFFQWSLTALVASKLLGAKLWVAYERTEFTERNAPHWRKHYRRLFSKTVSGFLVNGSLTASYLRGQLSVSSRPIIEGCMAAGEPGKRSHLGHSEMHGYGQTNEKSGKGEGLVFLFVGQLIKRKGIDLLVSHWQNHISEYPRDTLLIVGDGYLRDSLIRECSEMQSVNFLGHVQHDKMHHIYSRSDVLLLPTIEDNWSLVVAEAMQYGLPIGTTIFNGCHPELIKPGVNGFLFDPFSREDTLLMLSKFHLSDLKSMGSASREIANNYTPALAAKRIFDAVYPER